jgi:hypothetical protein
MARTETMQEEPYCPNPQDFEKAGSVSEFVELGQAALAFTEWVEAQGFLLGYN